MDRSARVGQFPHMMDYELDPFVRGLQIIMEADGWKMKNLSAAAGMGETAVRDLIRKGSSPKVSTALAMAKVLGRTVDEITNIGATGDIGDSDPRLAVAPTHLGFSEEATPFQMPLTPGDPIRALYGVHARNPAAIYRASAHLPDFDIRSGDMLICDQARQPVAGEIVVVSVADPEIGHAVTLLRRWLSPWLVPGTASDAVVLQDTEEWAAMLYPVIGIVRGA